VRVPFFALRQGSRAMMASALSPSPKSTPSLRSHRERSTDRFHRPTADLPHFSRNSGPLIISRPSLTWLSKESEVHPWGWTSRGHRFGTASVRARRQQTDEALAPEVAKSAIGNERRSRRYSRKRTKGQAQRGSYREPFSHLGVWPCHGHVTESD
jgi:hypothetical protein